MILNSTLSRAGHGLKSRAIPALFSTAMTVRPYSTETHAAGASMRHAVAAALFKGDQMTYEIQTRMLHGWESTGDQFDNYDAAAADLADLLADLAFAVKHGHMADFNPSDYRIKKT
jgi:hypothetical protein